jgi:hypothetical protein
MKLSRTREAGLVLKHTFNQVLDYEVRDPDKMRYPNRLADQTFSSIYFGAFQPSFRRCFGDGAALSRQALATAVELADA